MELERLSENRVKLTITVNASDFDKALDEAFVKVQKNLKEDGFRPGKYPKNLFINKYGWEALYQDGIEYAMEATYPVAIKEAGVVPTDYPNIDFPKDQKVEKGKDFVYFAEVDIWPDVHLGEYKGLQIKKESTRVLKKDVEEYINNALKGKTENVVKEDVASLGDTVVIDFEGFIDGVAFEGGKGENYSLELGSNSFVPGFEEQLVGLKSEDEKDVVVTFPENYHEGLSGKEATFKCKVHEVKTKVVPTLTAEFVEELEIENVHTVEEYEAYVKEQVKNDKVTKAENKFEKDCIDAVVEASYAEFPQSLINSAVEERVEGIEEQAKQYKIEATLLLQYYGIASMDDFKKMAEENLRREFLEELIFEQIAKNENLVASEEEIEAEYARIAEQNKVDVKVVKKQYSAARLAGGIQRKMAIDFIKNNVAK